MFFVCIFWCSSIQSSDFLLTPEWTRRRGATWLRLSLYLTEVKPALILPSRKSLPYELKNVNYSDTQRRKSLRSGAAAFRFKALFVTVRLPGKDYTSAGHIFLFKLAWICTHTHIYIYIKGLCFIICKKKINSKVLKNDFFKKKTTNIPGFHLFIQIHGRLLATSSPPASLTWFVKRIFNNNHGVQQTRRVKNTNFGTGNTFPAGITTDPTVVLTVSKLCLFYIL